jgi:hypothetical protein
METEPGNNVPTTPTGVTPSVPYGATGAEQNIASPLHPEMNVPALPPIGEVPVTPSIPKAQPISAVPIAPSIPEPTTPIPPEAATAKPSLGALAGSLQSGGGKNAAIESALQQLNVKKANAGKAPQSPVNPLIEELRKQSAENTLVRPLRTYKDDISSLIDKKKTSFVSVVSAEADRRAKSVAAVRPNLVPKRRSSLMNYTLVAGGIFFVMLGVGLVLYTYFTKEPAIGSVPASSLPKLVFSENQEALDTTGQNRHAMINLLNSKQRTENIRLGSITQLFPTAKNITGATYLLSASEFFKLLEINIPGTLSRSLEDPMMLGLHGYDGNSYFLILKVTDYDRGFAGMLDWEKTMQQDLFLPFGIAPLRSLTPPAATTTPITAATTTRTTTSSNESTATCSPSATTTEPVSNITTADLTARAFVDVVVKNINARALKRDDGSIALLYAFPDKNTVIITSSAATLTEIVTRMQSIRLK